MHSSALNSREKRGKKSAEQVRRIVRRFLEKEFVNGVGIVGYLKMVGRPIRSLSVGTL